MKHSSTSSGKHVPEDFLTQCWPNYSASRVIEELERWTKNDLAPIVVELLPLLGEICDNFRKMRVLCEPPHCKNRFVVRLDASHSIKSPEDILAKMVRTWRKNQKEPENYVTQKPYRTHFPDAVRFRYVVNFLSDGAALGMLSNSKFNTRFWRLESKTTDSTDFTDFDWAIGQSRRRFLEIEEIREAAQNLCNL